MDTSLGRTDTYSSGSDIEYAKAVARKMFESYDTNHNSTLDSNEISPMMQAVYKGINSSYCPSKRDVDEYSKVLDRNHDGKITLADLEAICIKYLVGGDALKQSILAPIRNEEALKKSALPGSYLAGHAYSPVRAYDPTNFVARSYEVSPSKGGETNKKAGVTFGDSFNVSPYKGDALTKSYIYGDYLNRSPNQGESLRRSGAGETPNRSPYQGELLKRSGAGETLNRSLYQGELLKRSGVGETLARSSVVGQNGRFSKIRRVFDKYDQDKNGFIDDSELKILMEETYKIVGATKVINSSDIQSYLALVDTNKDGKISYPEYEDIVVKALAKINVKLE